MNVINNIIAVLVAITAAQPVIVIKRYLNNVKNITDFSALQVTLMSIELLVLTIFIYSGYGFFIYKNISLAKFYPVVKTIEIIIPVIVSVVVYNQKLNMYKYLGFLFLLLGIICIEI